MFSQIILLAGDTTRPACLCQSLSFSCLCKLQSSQALFTHLIKLISLSIDCTMATRSRLKKLTKRCLSNYSKIIKQLINNHIYLSINTISQFSASPPINPHTVTFNLWGKCQCDHVVTFL